MEERSIDVFLPSSDNPDRKRRKKSDGDRSYRADRRPLPDKTCARVPFASPLSGQVKGPGQGRVPFLASFDRCQGLRIDDHADYHSPLVEERVTFFFSPFLREKRYPSKSRSPRKNDYRRAQGIRFRSAGAFDARSKMDLRGEREGEGETLQFSGKKGPISF